MESIADTPPYLSASPAPTVLVVDDEEGIRRTLEGVLRDAGFVVQVAADGESAIQTVQNFPPSLVMLDIWLPGLDGLETLAKLKELYPDLPVVMISGHATIATAVRATQLGAVDFIEKPLDLNVTLRAVRRALGEFEDQEEEDKLASNETERTLTIGTNWDASEIRPVVFAKQPLRGRRIQQRTLARSALVYGQGLHSGQKSGLILEPLPPNTGLHFAGVAQTTIVPAYVDYVSSTGFATLLRLGETQVGTIEHLMSCLAAYGICNLLIKCNGEVPVLDGSASQFCSLIEDTGIAEQEGEWYEIEVREPIKVGDGDEYILLEPASEWIIDYTLSYPKPLGVQRMQFTLGDVEAYKREIAPARTFGLVSDIGALQSRGYAQGGRFDNVVLYGDSGPINASLRFEDEAVRHKILDAIGDLYLLGRPLRGKVTANMTGHSDNVRLLRALQNAMVEALD